MPDAAGNIKGIAVPELPWQQTFEPGQRVRVVAGHHEGLTGHVARRNYGRDVVVVEVGMCAAIQCAPGELRPA